MSNNLSLELLKHYAGDADGHIDPKKLPDELLNSVKGFLCEYDYAEYLRVLGTLKTYENFKASLETVFEESKGYSFRLSKPIFVKAVKENVANSFKPVIQAVATSETLLNTFVDRLAPEDLIKYWPEMDLNSQILSFSYILEPDNSESISRDIIDKIVESPELLESLDLRYDLLFDRFKIIAKYAKTEKELELLSYWLSDENLVNCEAFTSSLAMKRLEKESKSSFSHTYEMYKLFKDSGILEEDVLKELEEVVDNFEFLGESPSAELSYETKKIRRRENDLDAFVANESRYRMYKRPFNILKDKISKNADDHDYEVNKLILQTAEERLKTIALNKHFREQSKK